MPSLLVDWRYRSVLSSGDICWDANYFTGGNAKLNCLKPLFTLKQKNEAEAEARPETCFGFGFMEQPCLIFGGRA
jgi:hypothetical protein